MHKKPRADKKTGARNRDLTITFARQPRPAPRRTPKSIKELLSNRHGLERIAHAIPQARSWEEWLRAALPLELAAHVRSALPKAPELIIFADNAAWATRLRYALVALQAAILERDAALTRTNVRVKIGG
ncbi:MAG TPA: DciA family protein [Steroidobacteraceae bacterium]